MKNIRPKDGSGERLRGSERNPDRHFHGEKRKNETHGSTTDPEAKMLRKGLGKEVKLYYMGHALMENNNGLVVDSPITQVGGTAERDSAIEMPAEHPVTHQITVGAGKHL